MTVYRCSHCKHLGEHTAPVGIGKCAQCGSETKLYDTVFFINQILVRYSTALRELEALKCADDGEPAEAAREQDGHVNPLAGQDFSETDILANAAQHRPLEQWFAKHRIKADFDYGKVDMSGYYDEAAATIGKHYDLFKDVLSKINWAYRNNHSGANFDLKKYNQKDAQTLNRICREFYSHTLFSRYHYQKPEKLLNLKLQSAPPVRQFFTGGWLEWFALGKLLAQAAQRGQQYTFSCARSVNIRFDNQDLHELDVVFLPAAGAPLVIECKTGEYRRDLDKYLNLKKRLGIDACHFMILVTDIDESQAKSLRAMYDLTFVTPQSLAAYLQEVM